jgi:hypothetical protein
VIGGQSRGVSDARALGEIGCGGERGVEGFGVYPSLTDGADMIVVRGEVGAVMGGGADRIVTFG